MPAFTCHPLPPTQGATCDLDGRGIKVPGYPDGNWVGPTLLSNVTPAMECYQTEIFGPVLVCIEVRQQRQHVLVERWRQVAATTATPRGIAHGTVVLRLRHLPCILLPFVAACQAASLDEAIALVNSNEHGNGTAIFTASGAAARKYQNEIDVGMVRRPAAQRPVPAWRVCPVLAAGGAAARKCQHEMGVVASASRPCWVCLWECASLIKRPAATPAHAIVPAAHAGLTLLSNLIDFTPLLPSQVGVNIPIPVPLPMFSFTGACAAAAGGGEERRGGGAGSAGGTRVVQTNQPVPGDGSAALSASVLRHPPYARVHARRCFPRHACRLARLLPGRPADVRPHGGPVLHPHKGGLQRLMPPAATCHDDAPAARVRACCFAAE